MRTLIIGDLHGFYDGLMQVLDRANYNPQQDRLVHLGDIVDGFQHSVDILEFFLTVKNKVLVRGNHDLFALRYMMLPTDASVNEWLKYGGQSTIAEFKSKNILPGTPKFNLYKILLESQVNYWVSEENNLCVHAGLGEYPTVQNVPDDDIFYFDRTMWQHAVKNKPGVDFQNNYTQVFIGHTTLYATTSNKKSLSPTAQPVKYRNIWNIDTGAGWGGKVTVMNMTTNEYWQSDFAPFSPR